MQRSISTFGRRLIGPSKMLACVLFFLAPSVQHAAAQAKEYKVDWTRSCPPSGYLTAKEKADIRAGKIANPTTALDFDLNGDKTNDSWEIGITLEDAFPTRDDQRSDIFLVGIPDPAGRGFGADYYSPRFRRKNDATEGFEVGQCVYTYGRNLWIVEFADANKNKVADQFLKSVWRCRNGDVNAANYNERTFFTTDLTKAKLATERVVVPAPKPNEANSVLFVNAMVDNEEEASDVRAMQTMDDEEEPDCYASLDDFGQVATPGQVVTLVLTLTNTDVEPHSYTVSMAGRNVSLLSIIEPITLEPGESASCEIQALVLPGGDTASIHAFARAVDDPTGNGWLASAIFDVVSLEERLLHGDGLFTE